MNTPNASSTEILGAELDSAPADKAAVANGFHAGRGSVLAINKWEVTDEAIITISRLKSQHETPIQNR